MKFSTMFYCADCIFNTLLWSNFQNVQTIFIVAQCLTTFFQMGDKQNIAPNYISFVPINKGDNQVMNGDFNNVEVICAISENNS